MLSLSFCLSSGDDKYEVSWGAGDDGGGDGGSGGDAGDGGRGGAGGGGGGGDGGGIEGDDDVGGEELCSCS